MASLGLTSPTSVNPRFSIAARRFSRSSPGKQFASLSLVRNVIHPDIDDGRAFADVLAADESGTSDRGDENISLPRDRRQIRVREWQIVTVAFSCKSSIAIGLPTILLRPTMTAFLPAISMSERFNISITPAGVHGTSALVPCMSRPAFTG